MNWVVSRQRRLPATLIRSPVSVLPVGEAVADLSAGGER